MDIHKFAMCIYVCVSVGVCVGLIYLLLHELLIIDSLVLNCSICIANAQKTPQSCTKPLTCSYVMHSWQWTLFCSDCLSATMVKSVFHNWTTSKWHPTERINSSSRMFKHYHILIRYNETINDDKIKDGLPLTTRAMYVLLMTSQLFTQCILETYGCDADACTYHSLD